MEIAQDNPAPATPGQVLAESRERQGLSRAEVAQRLHMSPLQVEALESGDYTRLPKGTFLRGFVRNYAKLLNVDAEPLIAGLTPASPRAAAIVVPSQNIRFEPLHERISSSPYVKGGLIAAVVLALGFATLYWWTEIRGSPPAAATKAPEAPAAKQIAAAPLPAAETPPPTEAPSAEPVPAVAKPAAPAAKPAAEAPKASVPATPAPAPTPPLAVPQGGGSKAATVPPGGGKSGRLVFSFRGASWVEVKDASGEVILSRLNTAGSQAAVTGKLPLTVIVGNAPDVTMRYNDREFPLEPHTKVAVARFTVE